MSTVAAVLLAGEPTAAVDAGEAAWELAEAMADDVLAVLGQLDGVTDALVCTPAWAGLAARIAWPTTVVLPVPGVPTILTEALGGLAGLGFDRALLVCPDAPDLPALHLAKVLRALDSSPVAVVPAHGGGLVALAARLADGQPLSVPDDLGSAVPGGVRATPVWRRMRTPPDLLRLDPGLEGWESTRTLLGR